MAVVQHIEDDVEGTGVELGEHDVDVTLKMWRSNTKG